MKLRVSANVRKPRRAMCKKKIGGGGGNKNKIFHFFLGALNRHEEKNGLFPRVLGRSFWKHVSISFDLRKKSEQLAWLRVWLKLRLRLKCFQVAGPELPENQPFFFFLMSPEPPWRKNVLGNKKFIIFFGLWTNMKKKMFYAWYLNPRQLCTWPTLAQFIQHPYSAQFNQKWPVVILGLF